MNAFVLVLIMSVNGHPSMAVSPVLYPTKSDCDMAGVNYVAVTEPEKADYVMRYYCFSRIPGP